MASLGGPANRKGKLEKGYIENLRTGVSYRFQFNPEELNDSQAVEYREIKAPGISYPVYQYVGGEARTIEFTLFVDNTETQAGINAVRHAVSFLSSFLPPANRAAQYAPPSDLLFAFGPIVKTCILVSMPIRYTAWDRSLQPMRAEIDVTLKVIQ